jgi:hypothetical protein
VVIVTPFGTPGPFEGRDEEYAGSRGSETDSSKRYECDYYVAATDRFGGRLHLLAEEDGSGADAGAQLDEAVAGREVMSSCSAAGLEARRA